MKRYGVIIIFAALFISMASKAFADNVPVPIAQRAAQSFLNSRMDSNPEIHMINFAEKAEFPNFYVFGNERCFVIIAADNCVQPILGYSLSGGFDTGDMPDHVRQWLQGYNDQIQEAKGNHAFADNGAVQLWNALQDGRINAHRISTVVAPLIQTKWNQNKYYNDLCPLVPEVPYEHAYTGCAATAMAQIMKYWNYPTTGVGWHSYMPQAHPEYGEQTANFQATTYDWSNMLNHYNYYYDDEGILHWDATPTNAQITAIATLMYHCGVAVDMNYSPSGSSASISDAAGALKKYFNYSSDVYYASRSNYSDSEWIAMLKADLDRHWPIGYRGHGTGGHIFVCDGYNSDNYFHFNWGWGGHYDAYFTINNLNPGSNIFNDSQYAVFGIHPSSNMATPTNLTYTQNERIISLHWANASGATSYNIYRDMFLVGNVTTNSYTEVAPYGTSLYYVRSADSYGELSLSSNVVNVTVGYQIPIVEDLTATVSGDDVSLLWTAPEWCYPQTPTATLNYGEANSHYNWSSVYYAHRYLAADLAQYANKAVYKVGTYIRYPGTYTLYVYTNTSNGNPASNSLAATITQNIMDSGWYEIELPQIVILSGSTDLWIVMKQENTGASYPVSSFDLDSYNANACYYGSSSPTVLQNITRYNISWFINTYITDGIYTYNIYRNNFNIASNVINPSYTDSNLSDGIYNYHVTTNYFGGESDPSNIASVQIETPITQTINFASGWNWWGSYVELSGIDGLTMLENSMGSSGLTIKSRLDGYVDWYQYNGSSGWFGSLNSICNEQMYKINMSANRSVAITGLPANQSNHPITIYPGWNWIGFPLSQSVGVEGALSGFSPAVNDVIKGRNSYTTYFSSNGTTGWFGSLNTLEPGCGYMYQSQSSSTKTLVFQPSRGEATVANITPEDNVYQPSDQRFADNMTVTAVVETEGEELRSDSHELATFVDDECRGSVRLLYVEPIDRYVAFLTVFGHQGDVLEFRLTDGRETQVSADGLVFATDGMVGTLASPKVLHFGALGLGETSAMVRIYPNPVRRKGTLNIALPEASERMTVEIGNVLGMTVFRSEIVMEPTSVARIIIPDTMLPGTYVLKAIRTDGTVYYGKLIVQ